MYATIGDVRSRARNLPSTVISDSQVTKAVEDASTEIDAYLSGNYTVPFTAPIPRIVSVIAEQLSASALLGQSYGESSLEQSDYAVMLRAEAMETLKKVAGGQMNIGTVTGSSSIIANSPVSVFNDSSNYVTGAM